LNQGPHPYQGCANIGQLSLFATVHHPETRQPSVFWAYRLETGFPLGVWVSLGMFDSGLTAVVIPPLSLVDD
jgi:hypothetical protein